MNILPRHQNPNPPPYAPTACLACIFPTPPTGPVETCDTAGILSTAVNLAASLQVTEALKLLTRQPHLLRRTLLSFDLWTGDRAEINTARPTPGCPVCDLRQFTHLSGANRPHITLCGRNSVQIHEHQRPIDLPAMRSAPGPPPRRRRPPRQRSPPPLPPRPPHPHRLLRRPRHHPGHHRPHPRPYPLRPLHRFLANVASLTYPSLSSRAFPHWPAGSFHFANTTNRPQRPSYRHMEAECPRMR